MSLALDEELKFVDITSRDENAVLETDLEVRWQLTPPLRQLLCHQLICNLSWKMRFSTACLPAAEDDGSKFLSAGGGNAGDKQF